MKSDKRAAAMLGGVARTLWDGKGRLSDVDITAGDKKFKCHKIILTITTDYFEKLAAAAAAPDPKAKKKGGPAEAGIQITTMDPDIVENILDYIYTGSFQLGIENLDRMLKAANEMNLSDLRQICADFMLSSLNIENCLQYWQLADKSNEPKLVEACRTVYLNSIQRLPDSRDEIRLFSREMITSLLKDDNLPIESESEVCELLHKWLEVHQGDPKPDELLTLIRWSNVTLDYKSDLLKTDLFCANQASNTFLRKVLSYHSTGIQFEGLQTNIRSTVGLEKCLVAIGNLHFEKTTDVFSVSLQRNDHISRLKSVEFTIRPDASACVRGNAMFVTGVGKTCREIWKYDYFYGWCFCTEMVLRRRRHCSVFVENGLFMLGGQDTADKPAVHQSIEKFNTLTNKSVELSTCLVHAVMSAACVAYKGYIYLFGGKSKEGANVAHVQMYSTAKDYCTLLTQPLPVAASSLRAVLWESSVILMGRDVCFTFDLNVNTWDERPQYKSGLSHFAMVLENQTIFVLGGGVDPPGQGEAKDKQDDDCDDEIRCVKVKNIVDNLYPAEWKHHSRLHLGCFVDAFGILTLPMLG